MVPGSERDWVAVNAVQQFSVNKTIKIKNYDNSTLNKIKRPVASAVWSPSPPVTFAFAELVPGTLAVSPPPDGGYPGNNTAEGDSGSF